MLLSRLKSGIIKANGCKLRPILNCSAQSRMVCRNQTTAPVTTLRDEVKQPADFKRERQIQKSLKKKQHVSFIKQLFLGRFDHEVLTFPEVLEPEKLDTLNQLVLPIEKFFNQVDSKKIDSESKISKEVLDALKDLGLFGMQIPPEYGGLGLNATEYARLGEITSLDGSIAVTLAAHQAIGLKGILIAGTEKQKAKYLPKLATGEHIAAFCLTETGSGSDAASVQTKATLSEDRKHYMLNGSKLWISNGGIADIMTVFAKTDILDDSVDKKESVTAFIVERGFGGVSSGKPEDKLGIRGSNTTTIHFDNTPVPVDNVIGAVGDGFKVAVNILNSGRFSMGSSLAGVLKKLLGLTVEHAITRKQFNKPLKDFQMIQEKVAKIAYITYAMESMAYLTAGTLDSYEQPDCALEAAIVKIFSSEGAWWAVSECLQILGGLGYMRDFPFERYLRDTRICLIFEGTNEILRLFIALMGIQFAGRELSGVVKKLRNPLLNPGFTFKKLWERQRQSFGKPPLNLDLPGSLHPSLQVSAEELEFCVLRFQYVVEKVLSIHGKAIIDEQMILRRLADVVIDLYAMSATLSRASRSRCIGLPNADHEMLLANSFCYDRTAQVKVNIEELLKGSIQSNDVNLVKLAKTIFKNKGYCASHALDRNWN